MFFSVLIPTYNYTCYKLVFDLQQQLQEAGIDYEIIVADDGSHDQVSVIANLKINELPHCRYLRRTQNVGRSAIRNLLIAESKGEWLLFLDSDARIDNPNLVKRYLEAIDHRGNNEILAGCLCHPDQCPSPLVTLRYLYEKEADKWRNADTCNKNPYQRFTVFNVLFHRPVFDICRFDEAFCEYGYEDTLLGFELQRAGIGLLYIDNPVTHIGLESNEVFLRKIKVSIVSLKRLRSKLNGQTLLERTADRVSDWHLAWLYRLFFAVSHHHMERNLLSSKPNLKIFALYKLGLYLQR